MTKAVGISALRRKGFGELAYQANRKLYPRLFSRFAPYYVVNEFPKSGGTWVGTMLAEALEMLFPRHQWLGLSRAIVHGHFASPLGLKNVLLVWRDPRDVFVSYYYHCYFVNEHHNRALVDLMKIRLPFSDYEDIRTNLPRFLTFLNETPLSPSFTWADFARTWVGRPGVVHVRYEDLRHDGPFHLGRAAHALTGKTLKPARLAEICEAHSFARAKQAAEARLAKAGGEMSFVREGSTGGWRKHFTPEAEAIVERYCRSAMDRLGYA